MHLNPTQVQEVPLSLRMQGKQMLWDSVSTVTERKAFPSMFKWNMEHIFSVSDYLECAKKLPSTNQLSK